VVKNKVAPPFMRAEFDIMFGEGISRSGEILDMAVELGIVKKSGAWFSYNGSKLGQGRDAVRDMIGDNPELADELAALIRQQLEAKREESKKHNSTFVPGKKEDDADADAEGGDDMFGDDFVDIEES
jgi:recombination protein RecA